MAQQDKAGEHRHRKGKLRFEPPDVERRDQRADDGTQRRIAAEKNGQQPGASHHAGQVPTDRRNGTKGRRHAFTAFKAEEYGPDVANAGGNRNQPQPERRDAQRIRAPDG